MFLLHIGNIRTLTKQNIFWTYMVLYYVKRKDISNPVIKMAEWPLDS